MAGQISLQNVCVWRAASKTEQSLIPWKKGLRFKNSCVAEQFFMQFAASIYTLKFKS